MQVVSTVLTVLNSVNSCFWSSKSSLLRERRVSKELQFLPHLFMAYFSLLIIVEAGKNVGDWTQQRSITVRENR